MATTGKTGDRLAMTLNYAWSAPTGQLRPSLLAAYGKLEEPPDLPELLKEALFQVDDYVQEVIAKRPSGIWGSRPFQFLLERVNTCVPTGEEAWEELAEKLFPLWDAINRQHSQLHSANVPSSRTNPELAGQIETVLHDTNHAALHTMGAVVWYPYLWPIDRN